MPNSAAYSVVAGDSSPTCCGIYLLLESRAEITNVSFRMDSVTAPDRRSDAAERVIFFANLNPSI